MKTEIMGAFARIRQHLPISALYKSPDLATLLNVQNVWIKYEPSLPTGSFKVRGAINCASQQAAGTKLFTHSSGNWAQGIAYAGRAYGLPVVVFMKPTASALKRQKTMDLGADVREMDGQPDQMTAAVKEIAAQEGGVFVSPYDHPLIIQGHASCGLEINNALQCFGTNASDVVVPVSGGGLAAGVAFATKSHSPDSCVICVEPEGCDDFAQSLRAETRIAISTPRISIADGMLANQVGEHNWQVLSDHVDLAVTVTDEEIVKAMRFLFDKLHLFTEPSGAITVAAALAGKFKPRGQNVVIVVSGANMEVDDFLRLAGYKRKKR